MNLGTTDSNRRLRIPSWTIPAVAGLLLVLAPWIGVSSSNVRQLTLIAIYTMVVCGINLSFGFAGELALGHVAMFAAGAYTAGMLAKDGWEIWATLPAAALAAAVVGFASGIPGLRLGGWGLAMTSFFLVILVPDVVKMFEEHTGGLIGLQGIPHAELFGHQITGNQLYVLIAGSMVIVILLMRNLVTSQHGAALLVLRQSPVLASALGINVFRLKMTAYVLGAIPAGIAGALFAYLDRFIAPEFFGFDLAIALIAASVLGGSQSVYGAFFGAALLQIGPLRATVFDEYALVAYGAFLVIGGVFFSGGVAGLGGRLARRVRPRSRRPRDVSPPVEGATITTFDGQPLRIADVSKEFGGAQALTDVNLAAEAHQITALIGPNGCGKTTLLNLISGFYAPTTGQIWLGDDEIGGRRSYAVARRGIGRTFQTPFIPMSMTTLEVVAVARYMTDYVGLLPALFRLPRATRGRRHDRQRAIEVLRLLNIEHLAYEPAAQLPLGSRRLVEVARAIAADPKLLLLDEPAAGLDEAELEQLVEAIRRVSRAGATVILVEHNFRLVCDVADHIYVLDSGRVLAEGSADAIRRDPVVARTYLGVSVETLAAASGGQITGQVPT